MAHLHFHGENSVRDYFTEQLLTILVCALFGFAAVWMYHTDRLGFLAPQFHLPVLLGGIGVLVLVGLRMIGVWKEAGQLQGLGQDQFNCGQDHAHTEDCCVPGLGLGETDPDHTAADHGNSDMSWTFARMLVLIFPVLLFFMGLPNASLSGAYLGDLARSDEANLGSDVLKELVKDAPPDAVQSDTTQPDGSRVRVLKVKGIQIKETTPAVGGEPKLEQIISGTATPMKFNDLKGAAFDQAKRDYLQGQTIILEGRFQRLGDKEFQVYRMKMACCAADAVPLKVRIIVPQALSGFNENQWVVVKGQLQFRKPPGKDYYIPVLLVADIKDIDKSKPVPPNEYEN